MKHYGDITKISGYASRLLTSSSAAVLVRIYLWRASGRDWQENGLVCSRSRSGL